MTGHPDSLRESVTDKIARWFSTEASSDLLELQARVEYMAKHLFKEYEPTRRPSADFLLRCRDWLDNVPADSDQRLLLELVPHLVFISRREFEALYRGAFNERITPWLVELLEIRLDDFNAGRILETAISRTWFCAGTDSMQISSFCHVNRITGPAVRPDWRSLRTLGTTPQQLRELMGRESLERIVILEDFVGSGTQIASAIELAASIPESPPVLVCPLVCCPQGRRRIEETIAGAPQITFTPVFEPSAAAFLSEVASSDEPTLHASLRSMAFRTEEQVCDGDADCEALGFQKTGSLVVLYTNCPNNTLPLVHHSSASWAALFPRSDRQ